jgi:hypothetical protein
LKKKLKSVFLLVYHLNPQVLKETDHWKREIKSIEKRGRERKAPRALQIKRGSQYFERRKTFQLQNLFMWVHFLPLIIPFSKPYPKSFEKVS